MNIVPAVNYQNFNGDVLTAAFQDRIICLTGPITDETATIINAQLMFLAAKSDEDIELHINSPGGSVSAGLAIIDTIEYIRCDVSTVIAGVAYSMAAVIASSGAKGKRRSLKHSQIMIHQPSIEHTGGQETDIRIMANHIAGLREELNKILADNCDRSIEEIESDTERDYFLNPFEAKEYGLIDEVL